MHSENLITIKIIYHFLCIVVTQIFWRFFFNSLTPFCCQRKTTHLRRLLHIEIHSLFCKELKHNASGTSRLQLNSGYGIRSQVSVSEILKRPHRFVTHVFGLF